MFIFTIYYTGDEIRDDEIVGDMRYIEHNCIQGFGEGTEDKKPPGRSVYIYIYIYIHSDNIEKGLKEIRYFRVLSPLMWLRTGTNGGLL